MAEGFIVVGLDGEGGVVGSCIEEGGFGEVEEDFSHSARLLASGMV